MTLTSGETSRPIDIPRADLILAASLGLACLVLYVWLVSPPPPVGFYWDDGWYVMMAEWFSGRSEHRELVWNMFHLRQYPPFYPVLLAIFGVGLDHPETGFLINAVAGTAAAVCLVLWLRLTEGFPIMVVASAATAMVLCPMAIGWLPAIFSEHFYILETVAALWLAAIARRPRDYFILGLLLGVALMTRSAGAALVCAVTLATALTRWNMLLWLLVGFVPATLGGWWLTADLPHLPIRRSFEDVTLQTIFNGHRLYDQVSGLAKGWMGMWGSGVGGTIALIAMLPGFWVRLRRHRADAWLVLFTLAMLMVWPYPGHMDRYLWPMIPALLVCAAETTRSFKPAVARYASLVLVPAVIVLGLQDGLIRTVTRAANPPQPDLYAFSRMMEWTRPADLSEATAAIQARRQLLQDMARVHALTPPRVCVYAELPALLAVQARRISQISPWRNLSELDEHELTCDYYYLMPLGLPGTTPEAIRRTAERHELMFQSPLPWDPSGDIPMGVLFRLDRK